MDNKKFEQDRKLIHQISNCDNLSTITQYKKTQKLTEEFDNENGNKENHSLGVKAYFMLHDQYPPRHIITLVFWKYKPGKITDDNVFTNDYDNDDSHSFERATPKDSALFYQYLLTKERSTELEALPFQDIMNRIKKRYPNWTQVKDSSAYGWCFRCLEQETSYIDTEFWIFQYGKTMNSQKECQMIEFRCSNMSNEQIQPILECMENFQCPLHVQLEKEWKTQQSWW